MWHRTLLISALCLALSGCLAQDGPPAAPVADDRSGPKAMLRYEETFPLTLAGARAALFKPVTPNCIRFFNQFDEIIHGNVTLTWTPESPLTERLELVIHANKTFRPIGVSPLVVPLRSLGNDVSVERHISVHVQTDSPGFAARQEVELRLDVHYRGKDAPEADAVWTCAS